MIAKDMQKLIPVAAAGWLAMAGLSAAADAPVIGEIEGLDVDAYCVFMNEGHEFVYADAETWRFVFLTDLIQNGVAYMMLDGEQRELMLSDSLEGERGEVRTYESGGDTPYMVTVLMLTGESGYEHTGYSGAIHVVHDGAAAAVAYSGDCGV